MQGMSGAKAAGGQTVVTEAPIEGMGPGGSGGLLNTQKDVKESQTEAKFGDLWKNIQSQYGAKQEKPREIKKQLGKDDFLRIMITQMKNQDPTNPFKAEQMATEMAQFTSVEQLQNLNQQMGKMVNANQPLERMAMTNMIGKTVTVDRERFAHNENEANPLTYSIDKDAKSVKLNIIADSGETVFTKDMGPMKAGTQNFTWDGIRSNSMPSKAGNYLFRVEARDESDRLIPMNTRGQSKVVGVSFEGNEGVLLVGDVNRPQKVTMKNVIRVDSGSEAVIPGVQSLKASLGQAPSPEVAAQSEVASPLPQGGNYFTFEKGAGSKPLDGGNAEAARAIQMYESAKSAGGKNSSTDNIENNSKPAEKGFPNGISSGDNEGEST
jgi:flagellar hook assembly protein FlgD